MDPGNSKEPPPKRCKFENASKFCIRAILSDEFMNKPKLIAVYTSKLKQKQDISRVMQELSKHLPLPESLQNLKRVHQKEIIICEQSLAETLEAYLKTTALSQDIIDTICESKISF